MATRPSPGSPGDVLSSDPAQGARRRRTSGWLAVVVAAVALLGLARLTSSEPAPKPDTAPPSAPASAPAATPTVDQQPHGLPIADVGGPVQDLVLAGDSLYVVAAPPARLVRLAPDGRTLATAPAPRHASRVAVDIAKGDVWVWTAMRDATVAREYDARTLRPLGQVRLDEQTFGGAAYEGSLWLGAAVDVVRLRLGHRVERVVSANYVFDVAADVARHRVVAALGDAVAAYDARTLRLVARQPVSLSKPTLAVVGNDVWVGGFSDVGRKVVHLDAGSLRPTPPRRQTTLSVGPGAVVWPGSAVVFVADGGSEVVTCVDSSTGAPLAEWSGVLGRVTAQSGKAFAVVGQGVVPLALGSRCPG